MFARILSLIGGPKARTVLSAAVILALAWQRRRREAAFFALAVGGSGVLNTVVKRMVKRPRPAQSNAQGSSFPSGHTTGSLVMTLCGAYLIGRRTGQRFLAYALCWLALPLTGLIGLSRILLREHHRSDVIGSYVLGTAWLGLLLTIAPYFFDAHKGSTERKTT